MTEFREVRPTDGPPLARFFLALTAAGDENFFHPHPLTEAAAVEIATRSRRDFHAIGLQADEVVSYGLLRGWDDGYDTPSLGIAVHPAIRGQGLGREMMSYLHAIARGRGATEIRVRVNERNAVAVNLYRDLGYVFRDERERGELVAHLLIAEREPA